MVKAKTDYQKQYEDLFKKEVLPGLKDKLKAVELAKTKLQSLDCRFEQNKTELETLKNDLIKLRAESVEHVMSEGKSQAYIEKMSKIKGRITLLNDAQDEIQNHLCPNIKEQLAGAYKDLIDSTDKKTALLADQVREEVFNNVQGEVEKMEGYHVALHSLSREMLSLPGNMTGLNFERVPHFAELDSLVQRGHFWKPSKPRLNQVNI